MLGSHNPAWTEVCEGLGGLSDGALEMNVLRLARVQVRVGHADQRANTAVVEADRVLRRRRGDVEASSAAGSGSVARLFEQPAADAPGSIVAADVEQFELQQVAARSAPPGVDDGCAHERTGVERTEELCAAVEALVEQRRRGKRRIGRPALYVEVVRLEPQLAGFESIDVLDYFAPVDRPDQLDLAAFQGAKLHDSLSIHTLGVMIGRDRALLLAA
jgi:hypothetical protein